MPPRLRFRVEETLGTIPALEIAPPSTSAARHSPSLRWLGASVLVGITGGALLGAAIYVASQGQFTFADVAERAGMPGPRASSEDGGLRKGDKLVRAETVASAKQVYRAPMTLRAGEREVIRVRTFTRLATGLSQTTGAYAVGIPAFNPMRFFAADTERGAEPPPDMPDAEVSVLKSDLSAIVLDPAGPALSDGDVAAQLQDQARAIAEAGRRALPPGPAGLMLARPLAPGQPAGAAPLLPENGDPSFRSIEVRVIPENVTSLPKSEARPSSLVFEDRVVPIRHGDTLDGLLAANGAGPDEARAILSALGLRDRSAVSLEGLQLRLLLAPPGRPGEGRPLVRAILFGERGIEAIAAKNDRGTFVSVAPPPIETPRDRPVEVSDDEEEDSGGGVRLYESLYETALKHDLSRQTVEDLIRIFGYDVDFQRRVQPGDGFELFYATDDESGAERLEILSAMLRLGSETRRVYRFQGEDGTVDWFDEAGRSLKKFLLRKPIVEGRFTSGFGRRTHPILGYSRAHNGVDWANKVGTPIFAAGNGTIIKAEWDSGYGRRIEIQHANGYVTTYNHQSAFARGMAKGTRVRQGQVIGYVGSTGLSTGAHLHYEVIVNGHFVDPMRIRVPRGRELDGRALADFARQREQIDTLMGRAAGGARFAQRETR